MKRKSLRRVFRWRLFRDGYISEYQFFGWFGSHGWDSEPIYLTGCKSLFCVSRYLGAIL